MDSCEVVPAYHSYPLSFSLSTPSGTYPGAIFPAGPPPSGSNQPLQWVLQACHYPLKGCHCNQWFSTTGTNSPATPHSAPPAGDSSPIQGLQAWHILPVLPTTTTTPPPRYPSYWSPYPPGMASTNCLPSAQTSSPTSPVSASTITSGVEAQIKTGGESKDRLPSYRRNYSLCLMLVHLCALVYSVYCTCASFFHPMLCLVLALFSFYFSTLDASNRIMCRLIGSSIDILTHARWKGKEGRKQRAHWEKQLYLWSATWGSVPQHTWKWIRKKDIIIIW
jgi:hypothetical protein